MEAQSKTMQYAWILVFLLVLAWSAIKPHDYPTWLLEVFPALLAAAIMLYTRDTFPLTGLVYFLVLVHCVILMVGGHYTYAEVPLFDWIQEEFGQSRNNYDKLGHFVQGFVPVIVAREYGLCACWCHSRVASAGSDARPAIAACRLHRLV